MTTKLLHALVLPARNQDRAQGRGRRNQVARGVIGSGPSAVESISLEPGEQLLTGAFANEHAELMAQEFEELFNADGIEVVPYTVKGSNDPEDGYYSLRDIETRPEVPAERRLQRFDGTMTRQGSRRDHWRAVRTNPTTEANPFGSATTELVGLSERADKVRWFDSATGDIESASVDSTIAGEHDAVDRYDATEPSFDAPTLIYDVPYEVEWRSDCRVWDDRDTDKYDVRTDGDTVSTDTHVGTATVGSSRSAVAWQRVYVPDHDFRGLPLLENDVLRLAFDEAGQKLRAYRWNDADNNYDAVSLGVSSWRLFDLHIRRIGLERIDAQVEFEDADSPGTTHNLNLSLKRGYADALWLNPDNEGSVPADLVTRLDPIAHDSDQDPAAVADVVARSEVDK